MTRIAPVTPPYAADIQAAFDEITPVGQQPLWLFRTLAVAPRTYHRFRAGGLLDRGSLTLRQREIVIDRTCGLNRCEYEWGVHVAIFAAKARLTPAQLAATATGHQADWSSDEQALLRACEEMNTTADLSDAGWQQLRAWFDESQILEIFALIAFYHGVSMTANALRLPLEPFGARFPTSF